jgi:hypothetical protein
VSSAENAPGIDLSDASFPEHPEGEDASLAIAYEEGIERFAVAVETAAGEGGAWDERLAAGLGAGLELLAVDPSLARLLFVEALTAGRLVRPERERLIERLAEALRPPVELTGGRSVSDEILLLQAHGLVSYLSGRVLAGEAERLPEDREALLRFVLAQLPSD